jgi:NitT/TauT family transport system substrate-binding protein
MIRRALAIVSTLAVLSTSAAAQERISVGTTRAVANSVLFLAEIQGHFKAEGLVVEMTAYASDQDVVEAMAAGSADLGLAGFTATAFNLAGAGTIKAVAAQVSEKADYEGNDIVVSNAAFERGIRKLENLANASVATFKLGTASHYQLGQVARIKQFDIGSLTLKPQSSIAAIGRAIATGTVDAAILPGSEARELMIANQAKLVAWYSEIDNAQLGALFASSKAIAGKRATVEKFVRAYRRAAGEYYTTFMRQDRYGKRISNAKSQELAGKIARYVFPNRSVETAATVTEAGMYYMDREARLDAAEVARQVAWYQSQSLVDKSVDARGIVDSSFK